VRVGYLGGHVELESVIIVYYLIRKVYLLSSMRTFEDLIKKDRFKNRFQLLTHIFHE
jgi:hypothetical protein